MFETIIFRSVAGTTCRIRSSILGDVLVRDLDAGSGGDFDIERELAGVGLREESPAEERIDRKTGNEDSEQQRQRQRRPPQRAAHRALIEIEQPLNMPLNHALKRPPSDRFSRPP